MHAAERQISEKISCYARSRPQLQRVNPACFNDQLLHKLGVSRLFFRDIRDNRPHEDGSASKSSEKPTRRNKQETIRFVHLPTEHGIPTSES